MAQKKAYNMSNVKWAFTTTYTQTLFVVGFLQLLANKSDNDTRYSLRPLKWLLGMYALNNVFSNPNLPYESAFENWPYVKSALLSV